MNRLAELTAHAQVGTRRQTPETRFGLEPVERAVLVDLGSESLVRRAGMQAAPGQPVPECPPESLRVAERATEPLREALETSPRLVFEWAEEAARRGFVCPPEALPALLGYAKRDRLASVLGVRGRWLADQMGVVLKAVDEEAPRKDEWDGLDPKAKAQLIENDPEDDVPLFEKALADRRKEVREAAAARLVRIPTTTQAAYLREAALKAVVVKRGLIRKGLEVQLPQPEAFPKWLPRASAYYGVGPGAMALFDVVSNVPPSLWDEAPNTMLDGARGTEYVSILNLAWQAAALRFDDQTWIDALMARAQPGAHPFQNEFYGRASEAVIEARAKDWFRGGYDGLLAAARAFSLRDRPISPALSRALVESAAREAARADKNLYELNYHLPALGNLLDPSVLPLVEADMGEPMQTIRDGWRKLLKLRLRLRESLQ